MTTSPPTTTAKPATTSDPAETADVVIEAAVTSWPGVTAVDGDRGERSFRLGRREIGHLHGDRVLHAAFPKAVWHELFDAGRIDYHPVFPGKPGYGARELRTNEDVHDVIAMLRLNYQREVSRHGLPQQ